jgi:metal-dependent amidase/aminoacylase/carboxypeptidase family protein
MLDLLKENASAAVDRLGPVLVDVSRRIHASPETAFREREASALLGGVAEQRGLAVTRPAYGLETAFAADFGETTGPRVAVISEYDALPDVGHACGHNVIAAIGPVATLALAELSGDLPGGVRFIGTPGEARGCGNEVLAGHLHR